jgi:hypothetical protein
LGCCSGGKERREKVGKDMKLRTDKGKKEVGRSVRVRQKKKLMGKE